MITTGTRKHSLASKARWKGISKKERSERMRFLALRKQSLLSPKQKKAHALMMVKARQAVKTVSP